MIFPDWGETAATAGETALPLYTEWAVDWEDGSFALRDGEPFLVTGNEALAIWVRCALHADSERFVCSAHSHEYGNELGALMGERMDGITESRAARYIREALGVSPYITAVDGFTFSRSGSRLTAAFTVTTVYGGWTQETEVLL